MRIPTKDLNATFVDALKPLSVQHGALTDKPLLVDIGPPLSLRARLYIYNLTHPPGGRTTGEHKIQLIVPGQAKRTKANFDYSDGRIVILAGYQSELDVFALWDSGLYRDFPHSRNVQVKAETLYAAYANGIATQSRNIWSQKHQREDGWSGLEEVVAATSPQLSRAVELRRTLSLNRLLQVAK
jgi:hypothetical protein